MALSADLASQFAKIITPKEESKGESMVYGTVVEYDGAKYVRFDGSDLLTPISATTKVNNEDRVIVTVKNHSAIVTGNLTSPAPRAEEVEDLGGRITDMDVAVADRLYAQDAKITELTAENVEIKGVLEAEAADIESLEADNVIIKENLQAATADITDLTAQNVRITEKLTATDASIETLQAQNVTINDKLDAQQAEIDNLDVKYVSAERLEAVSAEIEKLDTDKLDAEEAKITYADVKFTNIDDAAIKKMFADTGIIDELVVGNGAIISGNLAVVSLNADNIKTGTLTADRLMLLTEEGLYYQLNLNALGEAYVTDLSEEEQAELQNGIHGSNIIAESITAKHIVSDDLTAFGATIAGFNIVRDPDTGFGRIYSEPKATVDASNPGIYLDTDGQLNVGDGSNYLKFYKDGDEWRLAVLANSIILSTTNKSIEEAIDDVKIAAEKDLQREVESVNEKVGTLQTVVEDSVGTINDDIKVLWQKVETKMDDGDFEIRVRTAMENGTKKVVTDTGFTFDEQGLSVEKSGSDLKTQITEDGMAVYKGEDKVLSANNQGVDAKNLNATTYLIVGKNSRFEDYGEDRTACFWIGGYK